MKHLEKNPEKNLTKYYFNWTELKRHAGNDFTAIIILTWALTKCYNNTISNNSKYLLKLLKINNIPSILFRRGYLYHSSGKIISMYQCKNPQTYFINSEFLTANCDPKYKAAYVFMLGHRPITDNNLFIPTRYIDSKHYNNPFIKIQDKKLYFVPEQLKYNEYNS